MTAAHNVLCYGNILIVELVLYSGHVFEQGDEIICGGTDKLEEAFENSQHVLEGEMRTGAQEHFYMETHATIAIPHEDGEMELFGR